MREWNRSGNVWLLAALLGLLLAVGMGAPGGLAAPAGQPRPGGRIVWIDSIIHDSFDANVNVSRYAAWMQNQLFDPLVWQIAPDRYEPGLAERWEVSSNRTVYTFYLRKDVKFHDGTPFNAEAVKFTFDRIVDPNTKSRRTGELPNYVATQIINPSTVRVTFSQPYNQFLENLAGGGLPPVSPAGVRARGKDFALRPVGTGPFLVSRWIDDRTMVLVRNPNYAWGPTFLRRRGAAYLDEMTVRFVPEGTTRLLAMEAGEAHVISYPPEAEVERLRNDKNYQIWIQVESGLVQNFPINVQQGPTRELAVRKALNHGLDRRRMAKLVFFNTVQPAYGPLSSRNWAYWKGVEQYYPFDQLKARQILDEAGWKVNRTTGIREKDGQPLRLRIVTSSRFPDDKVAELAQAMWREIGVDARVELMSDAATRKRYEDGTFELGRLGLGFFDPDSVLYGTYHSTMITGGGRWNRGRVVNKDLDALLEKGRVTLEQEDRKRIYQQVQKWLMDQAVLVPIWEHTYVFAGTSKLRDVKFNLRGQPMFHEAWLEGR
ncbi:MAG: ABC transporter substrate-binding protein [Armatimonadetes bacterium]|nr:ABC transporter substrate-binding protein [Armatimonadota bacterium]